MFLCGASKEYCTEQIKTGMVQVMDFIMIITNFKILIILLSNDYKKQIEVPMVTLKRNILLTVENIGEDLKLDRSDL